MKPASRRWYRDGDYDAEIATEAARRADSNCFPAPGRFVPYTDDGQARMKPIVPPEWVEARNGGRCITSLRNGPKTFVESEDGVTLAAKGLPPGASWYPVSQAQARVAAIGMELTTMCGHTGFVAGVFMGKDESRVCLVEVSDV